MAVQSDGCVVIGNERVPASKILLLPTGTGKGAKTVYGATKIILSPEEMRTYSVTGKQANSFAKSLPAKPPIPEGKKGDKVHR